MENLPLDNSHPLFTYDPNKCVLCGKCVWFCKEKQKLGTLNFAYRGFNLIVTTFGDSLLGEADCNHCGNCVEVCPVGALLLKEQKPVMEDCDA